MARKCRSNPEAVVVYPMSSNPGRGKMKKKRRKSKRKGGRRCSVRHIVKCRGGKRRKTRSKSRKTRKSGKRGGKGAYARHVKAMWRKHRKKLTALGFKRASKYISSTYKR